MYSPAFSVILLVVKRIFPLLSLTVLALTPLVAQQADMMADAVRAYQTGDYKTAKSMFESLVSLNPRNTAARNYLTAIQQKEREGPGLEASLRTISLPRVDFSDTTPREAMTFVGQQVDKLSGGKQKLNLVWVVPPEMDKNTVTLKLENTPANEVLRYIAEMAGLKLSYETHALKVTPDTP